MDTSSGHYATDSVDVPETAETLLSFAPESSVQQAEKASKESAKAITNANFFMLLPLQSIQY